MSSRSGRPNILLITTDTQRCDTLKCMGHAHAVSPNLDRLASQGVLFEQAHTSSPVCMPTRCSLLSGFHTPIHGCIENGVQRREDIPVFTVGLKDMGYTNIMVGKTHFGPIPDTFDVRRVIEGEKSKDVDDFYAEHIRRHGYSRSSSHPNPVPEDLFMDAFLVDSTIEEIERAQKRDRPFFAFCSLPSPHGPIDPPGRWATLYNEVSLPAINYVEGEIANHPLHLKRLIGTIDDNKVSANRDEIDLYRRLYYGLAAYCDAQIGRLIDFLDDRGLREQTLVIFTSDHGIQLFDHGFNDKHNYYDSSWRVPLIMSMPGTLPQGERRDFAIWNDITATILSAAGVEHDFVQGFDLFLPLREGKASPRRCAVGTLYKSMAVATRRWKLEYYIEEGNGRLFDRTEDPSEQIDLYEESDFREVRDRLRWALLTWRSDITDLSFLVGATGGGGPVARRIAPYTRAMKGRDAERRLDERVAEL